MTQPAVRIVRASNPERLPVRFTHLSSWLLSLYGDVELSPPARARRGITPSRSPLSSSDAAELGRLAEGLSEILGDEAAEAIGGLLRATSPLDCTRLVSSWATSVREERRLALARAFSHPFDAVGLRSAMDLLAQDASTAVQRAIHHAASLRELSCTPPTSRV